MPIVTARADLDAETALAAYAAHLGIPVHDPPHSDYPMWNGTVLKRPENAEDWAHEIAHWILADPERRRLVNYGWDHDAQFAGYDPADAEPYGYGPRPDLDRLPWGDRDALPETSEEIAACMLGFALLVRVGHPAPYDLYGFYNFRPPTWDAPPGSDAVRIMEPSVYADRRSVQPHVASFAAWLDAETASATM